VKKSAGASRKSAARSQSPGEDIGTSSKARAGNVLAESGLSFLGFGVQPPTASWGELLKQAFADPLRYWNLTLWPGLLIFLTVSSFNLVGEGLRKAVDPKSS